MTISEILKKMIEYSNGNIHDIEHFIKVWTYAKTIGELEDIDHETQHILEIAAIIHDIACPLCRQKYGNTDGRYQEAESAPLVVDFLNGCGLSKTQINRIVYLVSHHHTYTNVEGLDYQILLEADYLVNAAESAYSIENIRHVNDKIFRTSAGKALLESIYNL